MNETFLYQRNLQKNNELNVWLAFPGIYSFGMSSIGYLSIFKTLDEIEDVFAERVFTDTKSTTLKVSEVDLLGFSFSFELDFLSVFKILKQYNIPYLAEDREDHNPLIWGGGPVLTANPEPFARIFDFIMIGDAENSERLIIETIKNNKNLSKKEILQKLSTIEGVYVPSMTVFDEKNNVITTKDAKPYSVIKASSDLSKCVYTPILSDESYFSNTFIIEIVRGCPKKCGFCLASYLNLPVRFCSYEKVIEKIELGLKHTNKIALLGALVSSHPRFDDICEYIISKVDSGQNIELTLSSLRADYISSKTIEMLVKSGQKTATIAVEAGSDRLRKVINKNLTDEQIFSAINTAQENGLQGLKIYAMIGLPTETYEDLNSLLELVAKIKKLHKGFDITLSFSTFVPKAQTPFQYCERESTKSLEKKYEYLKKEFHKLGVKIRCSSVKWDYIQSILSRGDRRLSDYLVEVFESGSNIGCFKNTYKKFIKEKRLPDSDKFAIDAIDTAKNVPWDFIKIHNNNEVLKQEYNRLLR